MLTVEFPVHQHVVDADEVLSGVEQVVEIPIEDAPGDRTAGIDLGISNSLAIAYDDGDAELYPGNVLKQDKHYFTRDEYDTEGENGPSRRALRARQKLSRRTTTSCTHSTNAS